MTLTPSAAYLEEVVVTASRKPENVKEVPSAMTIVGQRQIQEQAAMNTDITNILQYTVPGLAVSTGRTSNTGQTLRGRQVLVLIDGVPQSTPLRNGGRDLRIIDPSAIERIEVIKGATSIYGNGADGGIINYITKKPSTNQAFSAQTWAGLTGQVGHTDKTAGYRLSQQFTGRINRLDYLLNGTIERTGLQRDATGVPISAFYNTGQMNTYNVLAKVGYTLNTFLPVDADPFNINSGRIHQIFEDRNQTLWLSTAAGGLNKVNLQYKPFTNLRRRSTEHPTLTNNFVNAILKDETRNCLWIGTLNGISRYDLTTKTYRNYAKQPLPGDATGIDVSALCQASDGTLWVSTRYHGLLMLKGEN